MVERDLIQYLNSKGFSAFPRVPSNAPDEFIIIELSGGSKSRPTVVLQAYAKESLERAATLADEATSAVCAARLDDETRIVSVMVDSIYRYPDPNGEFERYQATLNAIYLN